MPWDRGSERQGLHNDHNVPQRQNLQAAVVVFCCAYYFTHCWLTVSVCMQILGASSGGLLELVWWLIDSSILAWFLLRCVGTSLMATQFGLSYCAKSTSISSAHRQLGWTWRTVSSSDSSENNSDLLQVWHVLSSLSSTTRIAVISVLTVKQC